ncbi:hypothetical protein N177_3321 [Lutibaculum baratangense AMV1]|uniref:Uncharacterized protein n=1 Tax=Lutibaculum baratangense AMV1 TaxID=631454 RepID=V4T9S1_9HYPH|nr:hypothetical protein N177_3321 [Lutibaculum baratangense AMV1]
MVRAPRFHFRPLLFRSLEMRRTLAREAPTPEGGATRRVPQEGRP